MRQSSSLDGSQNASDLHFKGPRMIALAFLTANLANGLAYGVFGPLVLPMAERFAAPVSSVSLGMSLLLLANGLLAPVMGLLLERFSIRGVMAVGAMLASAGHAALALCSDMTGVLACYALLIGPGVSLLGTLPSYTLISRWYEEKQGRAFGIVGLPLLGTLLPAITAVLLPDLGFNGIVYAVAAAYLLALPVVLLVIDRPERVGQKPFGKRDDAPRTGDVLASLPLMRILTDPVFLMIELATALTVAPQIAKNVVLIPILAQRGYDPAFGALLLSIAAGTAMIGSIAFGSLSDRIGPARTLLIAVVVQGVTWVVLGVATNKVLFLLDAILMGISFGGFIAPKSLLITKLYGVENYSKAMGLSGFLTLPFLFGMAPLMSLIAEAARSYEPAIVLQVVCLISAGMLFVGISKTKRGRKLTSGTSVESTVT